MNLNNIPTAEQNNVKRLFLNAPALIAILKGREGVCELLNDMFARLWGGRSVINKTMREAWPELAGQGWFEIVEEVYDTGRPVYGYEKSAIADWNNDGQPHELFFNFVYSPSVDDDGKVDGVMIFGFDVTQQVNARKKIEESESYFRRLADTVPAILWVTNKDGSCNYLNQGWYDTTGQTRDEALGFGWLDATHPDDKAEAGKIFNDANSKQIQFNILYRLKQKNGDYRWVIDSGSPRYDTNGSFEGFIGCVTDVHDQIVTEEKKKQIEGRYQRMFEGAPVSIWVQDFTKVKNEVRRLSELGITNLSSYFQKHRQELNDLITSVVVLDVNDTTLKLLQAQNKEDLKVGLGQIFVEDTSTAFIQELELIRNGGGNFRYETVLQTLKGNLIQVLVHIDFPYTEDYGNVLVTLIDISGAKKAESALKLSEERFRVLTNTIPQIVWMTLPNGDMEYLSDQWTEITGQPKVEALETGFEPFIHPDDFPLISSKWATSIQSGMAWVAEYRLRSKSTNIYRWFQGHTVPLKDENGRVIKWMGAATDIQTLKEYSQTLEAEVAQRTFDLNQSNESLQQFAHVASHDLKEPLRKIQTFVDRIRNNGGIDNHNDLTKIDVATKRMRDLIESILELSHVSNLEPTLSEVDLNTVLENCKSDLEVLLREKNAQIDSDNLPTIKVNGSQISQVFFNLLANSLKFCTTTPRIQIMCRKVRSSEIVKLGANRNTKDCWKITFTDNGIGFDARFKEKIFEPFQRLHGKNEYSGTGIGLSIVKKIVERHNGFIDVQSEVGKGAKFDIYIPASSSQL